MGTPRIIACLGINLRRLVAIVGLALSAGCIPVQFSYWRGSIEPSPNMNCIGSMGALLCTLPNQIRFGISVSTDTTNRAAVFVLEIPADHVVKLMNDRTTIIPLNQSQRWESLLASAEGYRYENPESSKKTLDPPGAPVTRELVGSTWNTHRFSEREYGTYLFQTLGETPLPKAFALQLPNIMVDGKEVVIPAISFQYGNWTNFKGLFGT